MLGSEFRMNRTYNKKLFTRFCQLDFYILRIFRDLFQTFVLNLVFNTFTIRQPTHHCRSKLIANDVNNFRGASGCATASSLIWERIVSFSTSSGSGRWLWESEPQLFLWSRIPLLLIFVETRLIDLFYDNANILQWYCFQNAWYIKNHHDARIVFVPFAIGSGISIFNIVYSKNR